LEIWQLTATELASSISKGEISAVDATQSHLSRMNEANQKINAVVEAVRTKHLGKQNKLTQIFERDFGLAPWPVYR
jgi:Asp-tRNA(Asn)/Glu-tRNA(Gln) amidotransferase A subunit family amidase